MLNLSMLCDTKLLLVRFCKLFKSGMKNIFSESTTISDCENLEFIKFIKWTNGH
jgi:hypothetical protein